MQILLYDYCRKVGYTMKSKKDSATKQVKVLVAMFEGREITDAEARKLVVARNRRDRVLAELFGLSKDDVSTICAHKKEVSEVLNEFCTKKQEEVSNRVRDIEARALAQMRDPSKARQLRALLGPR